MSRRKADPLPLPTILPVERATDAAYALAYVCCDRPWRYGNILKHLWHIHGLKKVDAVALRNASRAAYREESVTFARVCKACGQPTDAHPRCQHCDVLLHGDEVKPRACAFCQQRHAPPRVQATYQYASALSWPVAEVGRYD